MTTTTAAKTAKALTNCACSEFEIGHTVERNGEPDFDGTATGCTETTRRTFSPGHDAALKSLLIRAGIAGMEVKQGVITTDAVTASRQFGFTHLVVAGIERGIERAAAKVVKDMAKAEKAAAPKKARTPKNKEAAAERAAKLTAKMAEVAGKVTVAATPGETPAPAVEAAPVAPEAVAEMVAAKLASEDEAWAQAAPATTRIKVGRWEFAATIDADGTATYTSGKGETKIVLDGNYKLV